MSNGSDGCRGEQLTQLHLRMMRDRHSIPEGTKDQSAKHKTSTENEERRSYCNRRIVQSINLLLSTEELAQKIIIGNIVLACQYGQRGSNCTQHADALQSHKINIMLLFWKFLECALIGIERSKHSAKDDIERERI